MLTSIAWFDAYCCCNLCSCNLPPSPIIALYINIKYVIAISACQTAFRHQVMRAWPGPAAPCPPACASLRWDHQCPRRCSSWCSSSWARRAQQGQAQLHPPSSGPHLVPERRPYHLKCCSTSSSTLVSCVGWGGLGLNQGLCGCVPLGSGHLHPAMRRARARCLLILHTVTVLS